MSYSIRDFTLGNFPKVFLNQFMVKTKQAACLVIVVSQTECFHISSRIFLKSEKLIPIYSRPGSLPAGLLFPNYTTSLQVHSWSTPASTARMLIPTAWHFGDNALFSGSLNAIQALYKNITLKPPGACDRM
jgi:hypothetical protein